MLYFQMWVTSAFIRALMLYAEHSIEVHSTTQRKM